jgi:hypothetical protein
VAQVCNPSYSEGRDWEDRGSKPAWAERPYLKKSFTKLGLVEWLKVKALSSSPTTRKKKTRKKTFYEFLILVLFYADAGTLKYVLFCLYVAHTGLQHGLLLPQSPE